MAKPTQLLTRPPIQPIAAMPDDFRDLGGVNGSQTVSSGLILLSDGASKVLLTDGTSKLKRAS